MKLSNGNTVLQIIVCDEKQKIFPNPPLSPTNEVFVNATTTWQTKFSAINEQLQLNAPYLSRLSSITARYFCSPSRAEPGFEIIENEAKTDPPTFLFSQGTVLRICVMLNKVINQGTTKKVFEAKVIDLHAKKPIQITRAAIGLIRSEITGERRASRFTAMQKELSFMTSLASETICPILSAACYLENGQKQMMFVMPYFPNDFGNYFVFDCRLPLPSLESFIERMLEALAECTRKEIVHFDIKPENILCDDAGQPTLSDFGLANCCPGTHVYQLLLYIIRPDEFKSPHPHFDSWSMGCVIYLIGLLHRGVMPEIKKFCPEVPAIPHYFLLPWGHLIKTYEDVETTLKIVNTPNDSMVNTALTPDEIEGMIKEIDDCGKSTSDNLQACDCVTWITYRKYNCKKLVVLMNALHLVSKLREKVIARQKISAVRKAAAIHFEKIKEIIIRKINEMLEALKEPPQSNNIVEHMTYHMLHPTKFCTPESLLKQLRA